MASSSSVGGAAAARFGLEGKTCLVTGGTKGIGAAVVEQLCQLGARVYTCSRREEDVDQCVAKWRAAGFDVQGSAADVTDRQQAEALIAQVQEAFGGKLHVLVNNAGTNTQQPTLEYTAEDYSRIMGTNQEAVYTLCQLAHPLLAAAKGDPGGSAIVMISSVAGGPLAGRAGSLYAMSKAALNQLAKNLACEWAGDGIRVNSVAPWVTLTEMGKQNLSKPELVQGILSRTPLGRLAEPGDISGVVSFLCSPAAAYVTGQTLAVDGGYSVKGYW